MSLMATSRKVRFGSKNYQFPETAYVEYLKGVDIRGGEYIFPMFFVLTNISDVRTDAEIVMTQEPDVEIDDTAILLPVHLDRLFPLEKRFWEKPSVHYDASIRVSLFTTMLKRSTLYSLLVTPTMEKGRERFAAAVPFYGSGDTASLERFMLLSDFPVDTAASSAAVYSVGTPITVNWKTGDVGKWKKEDVSRDVQ
jgi:hypothetical protein